MTGSTRADDPRAEHESNDEPVDAETIVEEVISLSTLLVRAEGIMEGLEDAAHPEYWEEKTEEWADEGYNPTMVSRGKGRANAERDMAEEIEASRERMSDVRAEARERSDRIIDMIDRLDE